MNKVNVGRSIIYIPNPSVPSSLLIIIFINIPSIFVIKPPINSMITDLLKLDFILDNMHIKNLF